MSELRPDSPIKRPDSARPRDEPPPEVSPPTDAELEAIERHLVWLPVQEGASISQDPAIGATLVRGHGPGPDLTYGAMLEPGDASWADVIEGVETRLRDFGAWPSILVTDRPGQAGGLGDELRRRGWLPATGETVLWVGHASVVPHLDPLMRIEAVQQRSAATHEALEAQVFDIGADQLEQRREPLAGELSAGRLRAWIIWLDQEPIAVARLSQGDGVAALQGIGVTEARRGQGYGTLMTTIATRAGMAVGNRIIWLSVDEANRAAVRTYRSLGFAPAFSWTRWLLTEDPRQR